MTSQEDTAIKKFNLSLQVTIICLTQRLDITTGITKIKHYSISKDRRFFATFILYLFYYQPVTLFAYVPYNIKYQMKCVLDTCSKCNRIKHAILFKKKKEVNELET